MKKTVSISLDPWLKDWFNSQRQGGYNISRLVTKAVINQYHLAPPNVSHIKQIIEKRWPKTDD